MKISNKKEAEYLMNTPFLSISKKARLLGLSRQMLYIYRDNGCDVEKCSPNDILDWKKTSGIKIGRSTNLGKKQKELVRNINIDEIKTDIFTLKYLAHVTGIPYFTMWYWVKRGKLKTFKEETGQRLITKENLISFIEEYSV